MKKELIFLGPPACGKGTQTTRLAKHFGLPHIDTGSLLRAEIANGTEKGKIAKSYIDKGNLVPVELVGSINKEIDKDNDADFRAIYFDIDPDILISRIVNRRSCSNCGEIYNLKYKPPKVEGKCDICSSPLTQRKDDNEETAKARFETYYRETHPLFDYYNDKKVLKSIDASGSIDEVWERLLKAVED